MDEPQDRPLWQRLGSITVLGLVASVIRFWLKA